MIITLSLIDKTLSLVIDKTLSLVIDKTLSLDHW